MNPADNLVIAQNLEKHFGKFVAVNHVDLLLKKGEVFGLLGANGAGKTTVIRMLCGLLSPTSGNIQIAGVDMVKHARYARQKIGYVAQGFALYEDLRVKENLQLQAGLYGLRGKQKKDRVAWALEHLQIKQFNNTYAGELPLGYKRRLSFAAALLHQPQVLFLDEPTSGVDALGRQDFWELIYNLAESGMAILVTTHYMDEATFCDRLSLMHASRIIKEGTPQSLLEEKLETQIVNIQTSRSDILSASLRQMEDITEIIPYAGGLRVSVNKPVDIEKLRHEVGALAKNRNIQLDSLELTTPKLEDIFVNTLATLKETRV